LDVFKLTIVGSICSDRKAAKGQVFVSSSHLLAHLS